MANLQVYDPFADAGFDDLFRGFFKPVRYDNGTAASIKVDVSESDNGYTIHAEIPGVRKEDIQVTIEGNQVAIGAETKRESVQKDGERVLRTERRYGKAQRSFVLPVEVDESASEARYDNGVLELKLAKKVPAAGRKLTIQ